ncbi:MAG: ATP-dependent protease ATPase subunit HslU [Candidatus Brocadiae bacterium]|nr:ATP-dependent protease ATPase subunit HslU [Candidatus Brocadiia bacterium]
MLIDLTPKQIVAELDRYIVGQAEAKKTVAVAVRNRWRRQQLSPDIRDDVMPKNVLMIGPTGVGKTEIARRLAGLMRAPFLKVEASRYTEVGYHGRDVESIVRDLTEIAFTLVRSEMTAEVREPAALLTEDRLLDMLLPEIPRRITVEPGEAEKRQAEREVLRGKIRAGELNDEPVEVPVEERNQAMMQAISNQGIEEYGIDLGAMFSHIHPPKVVRRRMKLQEARAILEAQEAEKLLDKDKILREAIWRAENLGIIFIDEFDKIASRSGPTNGPDVSREGVQRDLLPIVEGATILTRYGPVKSNHVLFIAAGAFSMAKPDDLIPELQGRFPLRVELSPLLGDDFLRILTEPKNALTRQYIELLKTEGVTLTFSKDALEEMAFVAAKANNKLENIGARRLHQVIEVVLEEVAFGAPDTVKGSVAVDREFVKKRLKALV